MRKIYYGMACSIIMLFGQANADNSSAAYKNAYALTGYLYPGMMTKEFQTKLNNQIEQNATELAEQGNPENRKHPCFNFARQSILEGLRKIYSVEHMRSSVANKWVEEYSSSELAQQLAYYKDPVIQRMDTMNFDKSKIHSVEDMNREMLSSGKFTQADLTHIEEITSRDVYKFRKESTRTLELARVEVDKEREKYFSEKAEKLKQLKAEQPQKSAKTGCSLEEAA